MCLMVYIASDKPLPLIDWSEDKPDFCVEKLSKYEKGVTTQFDSPYVYYVGSHQGCGCGFFKEHKEEEELAQTYDNYQKLCAYLQKAREMGASIQIFSSWDGDQEEKPEFSEQIELNRLIEDSFEFKEKTFYKILPEK